VLRHGGEAGWRVAHHRHGTSRDARRLEVAKSMGADHVIDVQKEMRWRA
jgi:NADPH:quinone reductase-like Zn-dependent oxidoreductase